MTMQKYEFQLVLANIDEMTEEISSGLYSAGCDDGTPFSSGGVAANGFSRKATLLEAAVRSAIADVQGAGQTVACVESPDDPTFSRINQELATS